MQSENTRSKKALTVNGEVQVIDDFSESQQNDDSESFKPIQIMCLTQSDYKDSKSEISGISKINGSVF